MSESIIVTTFGVESEAYQALSDIRNMPFEPDLVISQVCIVKKTNGTMIPMDMYDTGVETTDDTKRGGIIGSLIGIIGGPIGVLLGGSTGALIGSAIDAADTSDNASMIEKVCEAIPDNSTSLIALVSELDSAPFEAIMSKYSAAVVRFDAAEVAAEVERAEELEREMEKETRRKLREEKKEERKQKVEERRAKMRADFETFKAKFNKKKD